MTDDEFLKWEPLIHCVIKEQFYWAYPNSNGSLKRWRRYLDYDDLVSEGSIGLQRAWEGWREDGGASFKTYAYTAIYRSIYKFVDANITPISTRNWQSATTYDDSVKDHLSTAVSCLFFSEISSRELQFEGDKSTFSPKNILHLDWVNYCIKKIREVMEPREFRILLDKAGGKTFTEIGDDIGITRERTREIHQEALIKAACILIDDEEDLNE